jgi:hypothetical protein
MIIVVCCFSPKYEKLQVAMAAIKISQWALWQIWLLVARNFGHPQSYVE